MKANILSPQLSIAQDAHLGGTITDREILYRLADRGHRVILLLPEGEKYRQHPKVKGEYVPRNALLKKSYLVNLFFLKSILKIIDEEKIDILRVHSPYSIGIGIAFLKTLKRLPPLWFSFLHMHERLDWRFLDTILPHFADGITALSDDTLSDLKGRFKWMDKKITKVTALGVDTSIFYPTEKPDVREIQRTSSLDLSKPLVLFVGRLKEEKGVKILLEAWKIISKEFKDTQLLIIGQGELEDEVIEFCRDNKQVYHLKYVPQERLYNYYSAATVFAFPTFKEGFGMAAGEAMACEKPVVATNVSGVRNLVVDGVTGFLVEAGNSVAFSEHLSFLINHKNIAINMGKAGRQRITNLFSWEKVIDSVEEFIDEMLIKKANRV